MPLDPSIPLSVRPPEGLNIAAAMREAASLKQLGLQSQAAEQQIAATGQEMSQRQHAMDLQAANEQAWKEAFTPNADGVMTLDRPKLIKSLASRGIDPLGVIAHLDAADKATADRRKALRDAETADADAIGMLARAVDKAGNTPEAWETVVRYRIANNPDDAKLLKPYDDAVKRDPSLIAKITSEIIAKSEKAAKLAQEETRLNRPMPVSPGASLVSPTTNEPVYTAPERPSEKQTKSVLLDGKPAEVIFDPKLGKWFDAAGVDVSARVKPIPPASVQINNAASATWTDDQIDFYARQVKDDASKMTLVTGLPTQVRSRIEQRIAALGGNINKLSASSRTMREMATEVLPHIDAIQAEADQLNKLGLLGPIAGRWREFLAGKVGSGEFAGGNPQTAKLIGKFRADAGLMTTAVMKAHVGARGSAQMLDHFSDLLGAEKADISTFTGELNSFKDWMKGYAQMGSDSGAPAGGADPYEEYLKRQGASGR